MAEYHNALSDLSAEDIRKLREFKKARQPETQSTVGGFSTQWEQLLAEFASYYGWIGVRDVLEDRLPVETFYGLLDAGRVQHNRRRGEQLVDLYNSIACALGENGDREIQKLVKRLTTMGKG